MAIHTDKPVNKSKFKSQNSKVKNGFTLIELIIVFSVMAILSTIGIVALVNYSRTQALQSEQLALATMLQVAKSRAQSQVTTVNNQPVCSSSPLTGYQISLCSVQGSIACPDISQSSPYDYALYAVCGRNLKTPAIDKKKFSNPNISFANGSATFFLFNTVSGGVSGALRNGSTVTLSGYGATKVITVYDTGRIDTK